MRRESSLLDSVNNVNYFGGNVACPSGATFSPFISLHAILTGPVFQRCGVIMNLAKNSIACLRSAVLF
jgi:hypothetical protein